MFVSSAFRVRSKIPEGIVKNSLASVLTLLVQNRFKDTTDTIERTEIAKKLLLSLSPVFPLIVRCVGSQISSLSCTHARSRQLHFREIGAALRPCKKGELRFQILIYLSLFIFSFSLLSEIKCLDVIEGFVFLPQTHFSHF